MPLYNRPLAAAQPRKIARMLAPLLVLAPAMALDVDYDQFAGLKISVDGIPIVQGSSFQFFDEATKKGIYSSNWKPKQVFKLANGLVRVRFDGDNNQIQGTLDFQRTPNGVLATHEYRWLGKNPVRLENCIGLLWYPALESGEFSSNGGSGLPLSPNQPPLARPLEDRALVPPAKSVQFYAPFGKLNIRMKEGAEAQVFDARNYRQDWAKGREVIWVGQMNGRIEPNSSIRYQVEWEITPSSHTAPGEITLAAEAQPLSEALNAVKTNLPVIPQPKESNLSASRVEIGSFQHSVNDAIKPAADQFESSLWQRWRRPASGPAIPVDASVESSSLPAEGYLLKISSNGVTLRAPSLAGIRNGYQTLIWLVRAEGGRLVLPVGEIKDWPSVNWRGIHMFVGPTALDFQTRLLERYLSPLKVNNVLLQCERTNWLATPNIETKITMERADLRELFSRYRERGVEPTPLIQSLGHIGWLFENRQNLDLALNPEVPFTIDPRKEKSRQLIRAIWKEAVDLLQPKSIHFGLDEIDSRGLPDDPYFSTRLWKQHMPFLMDLSGELKVQPMMWGDILLGPGEGIDANHAKTLEEARERRATVPKGVTVVDWHYAANSNPAAYKSLKLFKDQGLKPIAASWNQPANIRGHTLAAIQNGAGTLQTTWAGYESSELNMVRQFSQFAAYTLAADYAWSGRADQPDKLGYDPADVLRRLYFAPPASPKSLPGQAVVPQGRRAAAPLAIDLVHFATFQPPLVLNSPLYPESVEAPSSISIDLGSKPAAELAVAADCLAWVAEGESIATVEAVLDNGQTISTEVIYGLHVRARRDERPVLMSARGGTASVLRMSLPAGSRLKSLRLSKISKTAGLRVVGITVVAP